MTELELSNFEPSWVSPPGETIADILEERSLSADDLAGRIGFTRARANDLLVGQERITEGLAKTLAGFLGSSPAFWLVRDKQYLNDLARLESSHELNAQWLADLPVQDMVRFGWIPADQSKRFDNCLAFFDVPDVRAWHERYRRVTEVAAFRTSCSFKSSPAAVATWLRQGEIESEAITCEPWNKEAFKKVLPQIRLLTREKNPDVFIPALKSLCAKSGVAVVILRAPKQCRASGATYFASSKKALLLLSFRYLSDDHFWFTFFHEAGHLLLHGKEELFLESVAPMSEIQEKEANDFAATQLIPEKFRADMLRLPVDGLKVIRFAREIGISPGIVVGQLQHYGHFTRRQLNNLKRRYSWAND